MRIALLILTLIPSFILLLASWLSLSAGTVTATQALTRTGAMGLVVGVLWLIAGAFALTTPLVSAGALIVAASIGLLAGFTLNSAEWVSWGTGSVMLVVLAFLGWRELERTKGFPP